MRRCLWGVVAVVVGVSRPGIGAPAASQAPMGPRMAVVVVGLDEAGRAAAPGLERLAEASLIRVGRFEALGVDALDPTLAAEREAAAIEAAQRLKSARQAIDDLDNTQATADVVAALALLRKTNLAEGFTAYANALLLKAASHATGGENAQAKQDLERLMVIAPKTEVPSQFFPPELIKFAENQRKTSGARGDIVVRTEPPGAKVWVNGIFRGVSPLAVKGLAVGTRHVLTAWARGYALVQDEVAVGETVLTLTPSELAPAAGTLQRLVTANPLGPGRDAAAVSYGKQLGASQVLLVVAKKSAEPRQVELTALRIEVRDGHNAAYRVLSLDPGDVEAIEPFFDALQRSDDPRRAGAPVTHFPTSPKREVEASSTFNRPLVGAVLLGSGAVLAGIGVVAGLQAQSAHTSFRQTPQVQTGIASSFATQGRTFSVVADVSFVLALGSAIAGTVVLATAPKAPAVDPNAPVEWTPEAPRQAPGEDATAPRQRESEKRAPEVEKKRADDAKRQEAAEAETRRRDADAEKKRADDAKRQEAAEAETRRRDADAEKKRADDAKRQEAAEAEMRRRDADAEKKRADDAKRQEAAEAEMRRRDAAAEKKRADDAKRQEAAEAGEKKRADEAKRREAAEAEAAAAEAKRREAADAEVERKRADDLRRRDDDAKRKEAEAKKKQPEPAPKLAPPPPPPDVKSSEDHDDLRNY